ncbi:monovalent cation/H+ antiporter subunit A [Caldimonas tepidiphila]|uniref:monovalent cation/H+ antiporter subunit A n=1 Tax=Caldimonas tepidiphila TaxID=2315841 RepID=UPI000E5B13FC|nr:monovalent cation/H+ antiporter subunit A [Caldimonas tepidiphila]
MLLLTVLLPLFLGTTLPALLNRSGAGTDAPSHRRAWIAWCAAAVTASSLGLLLSQAPAVFAGQTLLETYSWVPQIGLNLGFRLDGLALMFALLITGIGLLIILYAHYYLSPEDSAAKFYSLMMLFMAAMLGVVLSDNLLVLVVFWEATSLSSFLLVGYWQHKAEARDGARTALAVTGGGGLAMLAGIVILGQIAGTYDLSAMLGRAAEIQADPRYPAALVLILLGCFTKSAQFPFHFWLPQAMAAPTPVSAYLHSATMVKAGVFLLARLNPVLGGTELFHLLVAGAGIVTLAFAAFVAVFKHDLKGLLAYSTISHLGLITFLIGLGSPLSAVAAVFHVLNHATFKASLFMTAGIIDHETGTRDMRRLGGLWKYMPWTATLAMVAAASMAGVPLANGFLSKEMFFTETVTASETWLLPAAATFAGICSVAYSLRFIHDVFFNGPPKDLPDDHPHEPPFFMKAPVGLLVVICLVVGVLPALTFGPMVHVAATAVAGAPLPEYHLAIWHGFNLPLLMSAIALVGGVAMYFALHRLFRLHEQVIEQWWRGWTGFEIFSRAIDSVFRLCGRLTLALENGSLQRYAAWLTASAVVVVAVPLWQHGSPGTGTRELLPANPLAIALWLVLAASCGAIVLMHHDRFKAVVLTGLVGLVAALTFVSLSAPDLALTQLSVEVVSTVLLLMGLALLPQHSPRESGAARRVRDGVLALAGGGGLAWLTWLMLTRDHDSISWFFLEQSVPGGGGTNSVNVILVDFRGYDTFGEITVLGIAALGVMALLDGMRARRPGADPAGRAWTFAATPLLLRVASRVVLPLALVVTLYIFLRGHNLPGGGFIAGLITAVALVLQFMALGQSRAEALLRSQSGRRFVRWIGTGLAIAGITGAGAFAFGRPFLTSAHGHPHVPLLGELPLASAALFDLGVYITVVGATLLMLSALGAVSKESPQPAGSAS